MGSYWKSSIPNGGTLGVWKLEEELEELEELLFKKGIGNTSIPSSGNRNKKAERLAVRLLVQEILPEGLPIQYDGRIPSLSCQEHRISITHDREMVGVQICPDTFPAGVDIQKKQPRKLERIAPRFLNEGELKELEKLGEEERSSALNILWCAKEALYKGACNGSLRDGMEVEPFRPEQEGELKAKVRHPEGREGSFQMAYTSFGEHHFVHITDGEFI